MKNKSKSFSKYIKHENHKSKEILSKSLSKIDNFTVTIDDCPDRNKILKDFPFLRTVPVDKITTVVNNETGYTFRIMKLF
jgi:hypothetical protein